MWSPHGQGSSLSEQLSCQTCRASSGMVCLPSAGQSRYCRPSLWTARCSRAAAAPLWIWTACITTIWVVPELHQMVLKNHYISIFIRNNWFGLLSDICSNLNLKNEENSPLFCVFFYLFLVCKLSSHWEAFLFLEYHEIIVWCKVGGPSVPPQSGNTNMWSHAWALLDCSSVIPQRSVRGPWLLHMCEEHNDINI